MSEDKNAADGLAALAGLLGASELGYRLTTNPDGYILAVIYSALTGFIQDLANQVALRLDQAWGTLNDTVIGGLFVALGAPGRLIGGLLTDLVDGVNASAADLAASLGPVGFLAIPVAWSAVILGIVGLAVGTWGAYKWIRTVVA